MTNHEFCAQNCQQPSDAAFFGPHIRDLGPRTPKCDVSLYRLRIFTYKRKTSSKIGPLIELL